MTPIIETISNSYSHPKVSIYFIISGIEIQDAVLQVWGYSTVWSSGVSSRAQEEPKKTLTKHRQQIIPRNTQYSIKTSWIKAVMSHLAQKGDLLDIPVVYFVLCFRFLDQLVLLQILLLKKAYHVPDCMLEGSFNQYE